MSQPQGQQLASQLLLVSNMRVLCETLHQSCHMPTNMADNY